MNEANTLEAARRNPFRCPDSVLRAAQALQLALLEAVEREGCTVYSVEVAEGAIRMQGDGRISGAETRLSDAGYRYETLSGFGVTLVGVSVP